MAPPDLNSLPPSPSPAIANSPTASRSPRNMAQQESLPTHPHLHSHSPSSHSLAAAAALNAGLHSDNSRRSSNSSLREARIERRRRSSIRMSLNLNDPTIPGPGELQTSPTLVSRTSSRPGSTPFPPSPNHQRAPSLGELHQEWESEQESQVNRLLNMIRQQQATIQTLQNQNPPTSSSAVDDGTPTSEHSAFPLHPATSSHQAPAAPSSAPRSHSPYVAHSLSRNPSYQSGSSSHHGSPAIHGMPGHYEATHETGELSLGPAAPRDESAFYQAETQNLTRENQMLKLRIRELERQLSDVGSSHSPHSPATASNLILPPITNPAQATAAE